MDRGLKARLDGSEQRMVAEAMKKRLPEEKPNQELITHQWLKWTEIPLGFISELRDF